MNDWLLVYGRLISFHHIFIRSLGRYSDANLLCWFGLPDYRPSERRRRRHWQHVVMADDGEWTMIADDLRYTIGSLPGTRSALAELARDCDVFACSVGDCDESFDFVYYRGSQLVRRYVVDDPNFGSPTVYEDTGDPLPGEEAAFRAKDPDDIVLGVAASLGIRTNYPEWDLRVYVPPEPAWPEL